MPKLLFVGNIAVATWQAMVNGWMGWLLAILIGFIVYAVWDAIVNPITKD
jgi:hypothetical protein